MYGQATLFWYADEAGNPTGLPDYRTDRQFLPARALVCGVIINSAEGVKTLVDFDASDVSLEQETALVELVTKIEAEINHIEDD
jgi:hypothetical protein